MGEAPTLRGSELEELSRSLEETRTKLDAWVAAARAEVPAEVPAEDPSEDSPEVAADVREAEEDGLLGRLEDATRLLGAAVRRLTGEGHDEDVPESGAAGVLRGSSEAAAVSALLDFLASQEKTGVLRVRTPDERFLLQLDEGEVVFAQGTNPPEAMQLGDVLVTIGAVSRRELQSVMTSEADPSERLGLRLLAKGLVTEEDLRAALAYQTRNIVDRLIAAERAAFAFESGARVHDRRELSMNVVHLLLEVARCSDESETDRANWLDVPLPAEGWDV